MSAVSYFDRLSNVAQTPLDTESYFSHLESNEKEVVARAVHIWGKGGTWESFCDTIAYIFSFLCCCCTTNSWNAAIEVITDKGTVDKKTAKAALNALISREKIGQAAAEKYAKEAAQTKKERAYYDPVDEEYIDRDLSLDALASRPLLERDEL